MSPVYYQAGKTCSFEFWYQIYGNLTGKLNVYIRAGLTESLIQTISTPTNNAASNEWKYSNVSLPTCSSQFQVVLEGVRGGTVNNVIAIDDIRFVNCEYSKPVQEELQQCTAENNKFKCTSNHCIETSALCDLNNDCCDSSDESSMQCANYYRLDYLFTTRY